MRRWVCQWLGVWGVAMFIPPVGAQGQGRDSLERMGLWPGASLGQPPLWQAYGGAFRGSDAGRPAVGLVVGTYRPFGSAVGGVMGMGLEPVLMLAPEVRAGGRVLFTSRAVSLSAGAQWISGGKRFEPIVSWNTAVRRGGIVGHGSTLRLDWLPNGRDRLNAGFTVPFSAHAGHTRPRTTGVSLPKGRLPALPPPSLPPAADSALHTLAAAGVDMARFMEGFPTVRGGSLRRSLLAFRDRVRPLRDSILRPREEFPAGIRYDDVEARFHGALQAAFAATLGAHRGEGAARAARRAMLDEVILPLDALLGRVKEGPGHLAGLQVRAERRFERWIADSSDAGEPEQHQARHVFRRYGQFVNAMYQRQPPSGARSRVTWLPPQFALLPSEHDEQGELDALIGRATTHAFSHDNRITYVRSTEVQYEFLRTIRAAREYHVLWLHDFMGRNRGEVDAVGFAVTVDGYLSALTRGVTEFDRTGRLPTFMVFLDQHFYDLRDGRLWMTLLEDPLGASDRVLARDTLLSRQLRAGLTALREAVAGSPRLQAEAARRGGDAWLRSVVRVHVSVTFPSDFTYRSNNIVPGVPFVPDNIMRDHRKLAFYDLREDDPNRGELLIAGAGVGEQYASGTWDDRALLLKGPAALEAKARARDLLRAHNVRDQDLPPVLRPATGGEPTSPLGGDPRNVASVLQLHNEPGFGTKPSTVARAMLYSLMPPGSLIVVPDPLWLSGEWAGMLVGAAMRGAEVFVIAPSILNAPSAGLPQISTTHDLMAELLIMVEELAPVISRAGGGLHIGIFTAKEDVNDVRAQISEISAGLRRSTMAQRAFPFPASLVAATDSLPTMLDLPTHAPLAIAEDALLRLPQLHQKTQFFATREAVSRLVKIPAWREIFLRVFTVRILQASALRDTAGAEVAARAYMGAGLRMIEEYRAGLASPNRDVLYLTLGSQNQDPRGMLLDGEASVVVSGVGAVVSLPDFYYMIARSTWITRLDQLRRFYPEVDNLRRRLGRMIRYAL